MRTGAPVGKIIVENGRAIGVVLDDGEEIRARTRSSRPSIRATTFLDLVGAARARHRLRRARSSNIRMKGDVGQAASGARPAAGFPGVERRASSRPAGRSRPRPTMSSAPSIRRKYGEFSPEPVMEITLPSLADPSLAPAGACVLSADRAIRALRAEGGLGSRQAEIPEGDHGRARAPCAGHRQERASRRAADAGRHRDALPHAGRPLAPWRIAGRPDADVAAGVRVPPATTRRSTGCSCAGAGSHPGGGISGVPGLNAARRIIAMKG